jgi:hypothetical protein
MRRLLPLLVALLLLSAATSALAERVTSGDGSLAVSGASARIIYVHGSGLIFGHVNQGTVTVVDYRPSDQAVPQVTGSMVKAPVGTGTQYSGTDIRFLLPNGTYSLRLDGVGIDISAVGKGAVSAIGAGTPADGTMATNGGKGLAIGAGPTTLVFGAGKSPNAAPKASSKGASH